MAHLQPDPLANDLVAFHGQGARTPDAVDAGRPPKSRSQMSDEEWQAELDERKARAAKADAESKHRWRMSLSGLNPRTLSSSFENFDCATKEQADVLAECRRFAETFDHEAGGGLWLIGAPGTGKTHLGSAMVSHVIGQKHQRSCIHSAREIVSMLRASWGKKAVEMSPWDDTFSVPNTTDELVQHLGSSALLVLDEIGGGFNSDAERVQLFDVIDLRYKYCRPTVLISNLSALEMKDALGGRAFDRLREGTKVLQCTWPSARSINRAPRSYQAL